MGIQTNNKLFFQQFSVTTISPGIVDKLFRLLEESSRDLPRNEKDVITPENQTCDLIVECLIKMIHLIHKADLKNQHQVRKLRR